MLGYFIGYIYKYRLSVCVQNLARAFPHLSYQETNKLRRNFYRNFGRVLCEIFLPGGAKLKLTHNASGIINKLGKQQRKAVLLVGHYGNWEILNQLPKFTGIPVRSLYKPLKNNLFNSIFYGKRTQYGMHLLPAQQALFTLLREKNTPSITIFIADQFPGHSNGMEVRFLQQRTWMFSGAEQVAKRLDAYVGYIALKSLGDKLWEMDIKEICEYARDTEDGQVTKTFAGMLEKNIYQDPSWWLWTHRRWK